ncbi:MAG: RIP metalloprotease RseP [Lachnospiraceae bacterium]|nr:RIP metalloprotease RseP [Lachnospiraceae bacterium]
MKILIAVIIFSVLVLFHELGHFLLAKKNGIVVQQFSLGMGPTLVSTQKGDTQYCLKLLPLGGSCMMLGEDEDSQTPGSFNSASVWGRIAVIAAGPIFNFIMAFILSVIIVAMMGYVPSKVLKVSEESPAYAAGLREGDQITKFQGYSIDIGQDLNTWLALNELKDAPIEMTVKRDGKKQKISYQPETTKKYLMGFNRGDTEKLEVASLIKGMPLEKAGVQAGDVITEIDGTVIDTQEDYERYVQEHPLEDKPLDITYEHKGKIQQITITPASRTQVALGFNYNVGREKASSWNVLKYAALEVKYWIRTTVVSLGKLFSGQFGIRDLSGPVGVVDVIGDTYEAAKPEGGVIVWASMLNIAVLLSANLGVMNLLPIPALDGGRLIFLILEAIRRKPVNRQAEAMIHMAGFVLLMALMFVVMYHDIVKLF